jgi:uncharacterized protein (TIGR03437 family)
MNSPFRHVSKGASAARQGDTIVVMDGTYDNEGVLAGSSGSGSVVTLTHSGSSQQPITFRAQHRGKAILDAGNSSTGSCNGAWAYFDLKNASFIVIQGFVIQRGCYNGIRSNDTAHDITVKWNEIRNIGNWANPGGSSSPQGIYINSGEYNFTFDGNIFHDIGGSTLFQEHAIYTSATNVTITNNIFYNNVHGWGVQTSGGMNILIANNTFAFRNPNAPGQIMLWDHGQGGTLASVTVRNNIFYNPTGVAVVTNLQAPISGCTIDHNIATVGGIFDGGSPCNVNTNWLNTDPQLTNTNSTPYDFHVRLGSPAIHAGVSVSGVTVDFDGAPRAPGGSVDIGACTYLAPSIGPLASVQNAASLARTAAAPGQIVAIFGSGLGPQTGVGLNLDSSGFVDTILAGTRVVFDGTPAPMIYSSDNQVMAVVPYSVAGQTSTHVQVQYNGTVCPGVDIDVADSAPGIFTIDSSGSGQGAILNQDFSLNSAANPASRGSIIVIYATGQGQTNPNGIDGLVIADVLPAPVLQVTVTIAGRTADILYAGAVSGLVSGILQVDARVPQGIPAGNVPVVVKVGDNISSQNVTMDVM